MTAVNLWNALSGEKSDLRGVRGNCGRILLYISYIHTRARTHKLTHHSQRNRTLFTLTQDIQRHYSLCILFWSWQLCEVDKMVYKYRNVWYHELPELIPVPIINDELPLHILMFSDILKYFQKIYLNYTMNLIRFPAAYTDVLYFCVAFERPWTSSILRDIVVLLKPYSEKCRDSASN
jgi:hypothetical protein